MTDFDPHFGPESGQSQVMTDDAAIAPISLS